MSEVNVNWSLVTRLGIQLDDAGEVWNSGCVRDLLPLDEHSVLVATDTGGIWYADDTGHGYSLQDFPEPDMLCLARALIGSAQYVYFAGTPSAVWATHAETGVPREGWMSTGGDVGQVNRIQFDWDLARVIIATSKGIYWSDLPGPNWPFGSGFTWRQAVRPNGTAITGDFVDLALTRLPPGLVRGVVATRRVVDVDWGMPDGKFLFGGWGPLPGSALPTPVTAALVMAPNLNPTGQSPGQPLTSFQIGVVSLAVASDEYHVYAAASSAGGDFLYLYRSKDGGQSWERSEPKFLDQAGNKLADADLPHGQGNGDRFNNCLSVALDDPRTLALGWRFAGAYVSRDGGDSFIRPPEARGAHGDVHAIHFDPYDKSGERLYLGTDGGVIRMGAFGRDTGAVNTLFNKSLATIQFASRPGRNRGSTVGFSDGDFGASLKHAIVAGGTQDTAVLYSQGYNPWRSLGGPPTADGHDVVGIGDEGLVYIDVQHDDSDPSPPVLAWWDKLGYLENARVTVEAAGPAGSPGYTDLKWVLSNARLIRIKSPSPKTGVGGFPYRALAFDKQWVWGFFWEPDKYPQNTSKEFVIAWEGIFGQVTYPVVDPSVSPSDQPPICSVGTEDGRVIYVGFVGGKIYSWSADRPDNLDRIRDLHVPATLIAPSSKTPTSRIHHIAVASSNLAFASMETINGQHVLLRLRDETKTDILNTGRSDTIYGVETWQRRNGQLAIFVSYDDAILVSTNEGNAWQNASNGLPRRPHCCSLHIFRDTVGQDIMYLPTFGRSMWKTNLSIDNVD